MLKKVWITEEAWPTSDETIQLAESAGANEILHGIPVTLRDKIPSITVGYYEYSFVVETQEDSPTLDQVNNDLQSLKDALEAEGVI